MPPTSRWLKANNWNWFFGSDSKRIRTLFQKHDRCNQASRHPVLQNWCWLELKEAKEEETGSVTTNSLVWFGTTSLQQEKTKNDTENFLVWPKNSKLNADETGVLRKNVIVALETSKPNQKELRRKPDNFLLSRLERLTEKNLNKECS